MTVYEVPYSRLPRLIKNAFEGDSEIYKFYDPNIKVSSLEEIVSDITKKVKEYGKVDVFSISIGRDIAGYFVCKKDHLISFGLSKMYRTCGNVVSFFEAMRDVMGSSMFTLLWLTNTRAIKYLLKQGMKISYFDNNVIKLQCQ